MTLPHWPAMLKRPMAAAYCSLSVKEFELEISDGRLPTPVKLGNHEHWNKAQLDTALEKISGGGVTSWRAELGLPEPQRRVA